MPVALVTGASGFVGGHLARRLTDEGWTVRALARRAASGPWAEQICLDLAHDRLPGSVMSGVDTVYHAAGKAHAVAELGEDGGAYDRANVRSTRVLLEAAAAAGVARFVFLSSVKASGDPPSGPADEAVDVPPTTAYGRSKRAAEALVLEAARRTPLHACVLRPSLVYGAGMKGNLEQMLAAVDRGRFPPVAETGNRRTMVHVEDLVTAAAVAARNPVARGQVYIVTDGGAYSTRQMYVAMAQALGRPVPGWTVPPGVLTGAARIGDLVGRARGRRFAFDSTALCRLVGSAWYSSAKIERELGFRPAHNFPEALPDIVRAYRGLAG